MTEPSTFNVRGLYWLTHEPIPPTTEAERAAVLGITLEPRR